MSFDGLLLAVWRETCRHIEINAAVNLIMPLLAHRLPVDWMAIRVLDPGRGELLTVAATRVPQQFADQLHKRNVNKSDQDELLTWMHAGRVWSAADAATDRALPAPLRLEPARGVVVGPLVTSDDKPGALLFGARSDRSFQSEDVAVIESLLEPLTIALENDRRVKELVELREKVEADNRSLLRRLGRSDLAEPIIGAERGLKAVLERVALVANSDLPVLILGETGSGKEVIARAIHEQSQRRSGPFLRVNCGAIPPELIDSELFGHERGSFTGATGERRGWFERANGGTLFLDECGELPLAAQVRLLRILQEGAFSRVGGESQLHVDVRVVAATHRDLPMMIAEKSFREDLWYRLAAFPIRLPPLRERIDDIAELAAHFAARAATRFGLAKCEPTNDDLDLLRRYAWPGNVRELATVIDRAAILGDGKRLEMAAALGFAAMPLSTIPAPASSSFDQQSVDASPRSIASLDEAMRRHIETTLQACRGRVEGPFGAAAVLGINPHTLRARMRKLKINWAKYRGERPV